MSVLNLFSRSIMFMQNFNDPPPPSTAIFISCFSGMMIFIFINNWTRPLTSLQYTVGKSLYARVFSVSWISNLRVSTEKYGDSLLSKSVRHFFNPGCTDDLLFSVDLKHEIDPISFISHWSFFQEIDHVDQLVHLHVLYWNMYLDESSPYFCYTQSLSLSPSTFCFAYMNKTPSCISKWYQKYLII